MRSYKIDQYFEFTFQVVSSTQAAADADSTPTYRVYEENNDTVIDNGNCTKRDDAGTTGYYYARAQCTAALGYEVGKTYEVRVAATVGGIATAAVIGRFVMVGTPAWDALVGNTAYLPVDVLSISGDSTAADNAELMFDGTGYAGGTTKLSVNVNDKTGFSLSSAGVQAIWDALTSALTTIGSIGKLIVDYLDATITSRSNLSSSDIRTQVDAALDATDAELSSMPAAATTSLRNRMKFVFQYFRIKRDATATLETMYKSTGTALGTAVLSNDGTTVTKENMT